MGTNTRPGPGFNTCTASPTTQNLLAGSGCEQAFYCAGGAGAKATRCDYNVECADGADERGCGEFVCGNMLVDPGSVCDPTVCPATSFAPPICPSDDPLGFLCGDGTKTHILNVCNGTPDCANGRDEAYCF
jgi:hypothetical protein